MNATTTPAENVDRTPDGRYIVVNGRRWRASDPAIPEKLRAELVEELMRARRLVRSRGDEVRPFVHDAKVALGERGEPWWEPTAEGRRDRARRGSDRSVAARLVEFEEGWAPSRGARRDVSMPEEEVLLEHHAYLDALTRLDDMEIDLVHNHAYHYLPFSLGGRGDVPWVSTLHTPPTPWIESALAARRHGAMRYTTVSAFAAARWVRLPAPPTVVANGIDPGLWPRWPRRPPARVGRAAHS